ncbi:hypothetical protein BDZ89DRAFT_1066808 [Hymenopellis radicata]|nr:hypothetical protein BDZ89DRAFT_1066808 [Hymenopellis radicata]
MGAGIPIPLATLVALSLLFALLALVFSVMYSDTLSTVFASVAIFATLTHHPILIVRTYLHRLRSRAEGETDSSDTLSPNVGYSSTAGIVFTFALAFLWLVALGMATRGYPATAETKGFQITSCAMMGIEALVLLGIAIFSMLRRRKGGKEPDSVAIEKYYQNRSNTIRH